MDAVVYRSFLVRAWGRGRQAARAIVEEVQSGGRSELRGDDAARLVAEIDRALVAGATGALVSVGAADGRDEQREEADDE